MTSDTQRMLDEFEQGIQECKAKYELYFSGEERIPPEKKRDEMRKLILKIDNMHLTNTSQRFRMNALRSRFNSFQRLWDRIMYQIEQGTYKPDKFKADMRVGQIDKETGEVKSVRDILSSRFEKQTGTGDKKIRDLYKTYIETRRVTREDVDISFESFKRSIEQNRKNLTQKYGKEVHFKISIENGKAKVKGLVKKG